MKQKRTIGILRTLEQIGLLTFLGGGLFLVWWYGEQGTFLDTGFLVALALSILGLVVFLYTNQKVNQKIDLITVHNDFAFEGQFMALFEQSPVPYLVIEKGGQIIRANQAAMKLFRMNIQGLVGTNLLDCITASDTADISIVLNKIKAGVTVDDIEVSIQLSAGEVRWVLLSSYANQHNDEILISLVDVTQAKKVDVAKSEFLALATHQLGTPIAAIRWNTELLLKKIPAELSETVGRYVEKIQSNTERMTGLIDDFLNVSKLELGTFATEPKPVQVSTFLDSVVDEFGQKLEEKNIALQRDEQPADLTFTTDERLLHIVVSNLLSNATKYVRESGTINLSTRVEADRFIFSITDDGIGIPEAEIEKLFTKFYRASNATKHQAEGTGLGLYVIKQALGLLGGTITVETDSEQGAKFVVTIPLRQ